MHNTPRSWPLVVAPLLLGIGALNLMNYLLFHTVVELAIMVVGFAIFTLTWNLRHLNDNAYFQVVGLAALFIGVVDVVHTLAFKGMSVLPGYDANLPTQLWIASRYLNGLTLIAAPMVIGRKLQSKRLVVLYASVTTVLLALIFTGWFPDCFIEGVGLTPFKRISEFVTGGLMIGGLALLLRRRQVFDPKVLRLQAASIALSAASGLPFMLYAVVDDHWNAIGHLLRLAAIFPLYRAIVQTGLTQPFSLLFRNLKQSEEALRAERNFVTAVLDLAGAPLMVLDQSGLIVRINHAAQELAGRLDTDLIGTCPWDGLVAAEEAASAEASFLLPVTTGEASYFEQHWVQPSGASRLIWWTARPLVGEGAAPRYVICTGVDVTEHREMEERLEAQEERHRVLVESVPTGMLLIDRNSALVTDVNPAAARLIGLPAEQVVGRSYREFLPEDQNAEGVDAAMRPSETTLRRADGASLPIHRTAAPVVTNGREQMLISFVDMTEHKRVEEDLRALVLRDELTGLYNRRGFLALAPKEIALSLKLRRGMFLLFIDLDDLQRINQVGGHDAGNRALRTLGEMLQAAFGATALVARVGSDEFVVLTPCYVGLDAGLLTARIMRHLDTYNAVTRGPRLSVSVGVATLNPEEPCSINELLTRADDAMYLERRRKLSEGLSGVRPLPAR